MVTSLSFSVLESYVGKGIKNICTTSFDSSTENHCAHFVSHALSLNFGTLCGSMKWDTRGTGASIRCDELYNALVQKGEWAERPTIKEDGMLIFVLSASGVSNGVMQAIRQKHVGILYGGKVYNYSNSMNRVVADTSVSDFHDKFKKVYSAKDISLFYGVAT